MSLQTLEERIMRELDCEKAREKVGEEFARYRVESSNFSNEPDKLGQARLTDQEIRRLPMGNQHTKWNVIRWQCVKAVAVEYGVTDWTAKVDSDLTYEENMDLMRDRGDQPEVRF